MSHQVETPRCSESNLFQEIRPCFHSFPKTVRCATSPPDILSCCGLSHPVGLQETEPERDAETNKKDATHKTHPIVERIESRTCDSNPRQLLKPCVARNVAKTSIETFNGIVYITHAFKITHAFQICRRYEGSDVSSKENAIDDRVPWTDHDLIGETFDGLPYSLQRLPELFQSTWGPC